MTNKLDARNIPFIKVNLSVILCTHNPRQGYIQRTLEALRIQSLPKTQWEFLLIDNASDLPLADRCDLSWHANARHLKEPCLGKLNAWLLGIREAQAEVLLFVDDDNVLPPDYLEQALRVGTEWPFVGVWGGSISAEYETPVPPWVGDHVWRLTVFEDKVDVWSNLRDNFATYPVGAGMCIRNSVAKRYIEWCATNPNSRLLDRSGTGLAGYGDMDLCQCAMDVGLGTGRSTKLKLTHLIPASRLTLDYFVRHAEGDAASFIVYRAIRGLPYRELARHTWLKFLIYRLHCIKNRIVPEHREIHLAHIRGLRKGLKLAEILSIS